MSKRKYDYYNEGLSYGQPKRYTPMSNEQLVAAYGGWKERPKTFRRAYKNLYGDRPRFGGPYRTGGFYGASVRSPAERKVGDHAVIPSSLVCLLLAVTDIHPRLLTRLWQIMLVIRLDRLL